MKRLGIDIGSTTIKLIILENEQIIYQKYERHFSQIQQKLLEMLEQIEAILAGDAVAVAIAGSAGMGVATAIDVDFVQEVFATSQAVQMLAADIDVIIELGGEDAKILFLTGGNEERMNGTCAGGTGAFIDQMSTLLSLSPDELDVLSFEADQIYPIASRCGVFAKSDIQPLLNQGASKANLAASIFQAVVDQTIGGLAQGREIKGRVLFLGGPLHFLKGLQQRFIDTLKLTPDTAVFTELGLYAVALGTAIYSAQNKKEPLTYRQLIFKLKKAAREQTKSALTLPALFENEEAYQNFLARHAKASVAKRDIKTYRGAAYLGIDSGSTTTKVVLISESAEILFEYYGSNKGNPLDVIQEQLYKLRKLCKDHIQIKGSVSTGYGEELMKNAFQLDEGIVETVAHFRAAKHFQPKVDFIIDIGGQDIKCFKVKNNSIDTIMLNEACSSGCGSFIESFAQALGQPIEEFSQKGVFSSHPADLGSRCTVFMNSNVKQAQKDGASVEDISAGLSISVVKNAVYKVIRAKNPEELGKYIVVQGGTFLNDTVLRSFELEMQREVVRPEISGLMGAFGAALYAKNLDLATSSLLSEAELAEFTHQSKPAICKLCGNRCNLTINRFGGANKPYISGNKCDRPLGGLKRNELPNMYEYRLERVQQIPTSSGRRGKIGLPLGLSYYELLPFWSHFLASLEFEVIASKPSTRTTYTNGQHTIPSDTVCYPAKLMHGHIEELIDAGVEAIFYPCATYNLNEEKGDNHFNCPIVAYYPELLGTNVSRLKEITYMQPYFGLHNRKVFEKKAWEYLKDYYPDMTKKEVKQATDAAFAAHEKFQKDIKDEGKRMIDFARSHGHKMVVLAGRPYHIDPEINHGIDRMLNMLGLVVLSEDVVCDLVDKVHVKVLNQWTYHSRLYHAAEYVAQQQDMELIQLVSFGCGIDSITSDETRDILERNGKLYTQLKIDEVSNLGAAKIRVRSLIGALKEREIQTND